MRRLEILLASLMRLSLSLAGCNKLPDDKAKSDFAAGEQSEQSSNELAAIAAYQRAVALDANSESGKAAARHIEYLSALPATVSTPWCARLVDRLRAGLSATKYANVVGDYLLNLTYDCQHDAGKTTAGQWACYWTATSQPDVFEAANACDKIPSGK